MQQVYIAVFLMLMSLLFVRGSYIDKLFYFKLITAFLPLTHIGGAPVAFATSNDMAMSSQFLQEK